MKISEVFQGAAFGMMDGVILIVGLLIGVSEATADSKIVIVSGLVGGIANAFGNSIGFYTSECAERGEQIRFHKARGKKIEDGYVHSHEEVLASSALSFIATITALIFPIAPFFFVSDIRTAMIACVAISGVMLFALGTYIAKLNEECWWKNGLKYALLGFAGAAIAYFIGEFLGHLILAG
ncbi:MAG: VIT1/CCC1 transporter family protein [Candidatus Micrarchaeota archaeon]